jgi:hypothetical protein
MISIALQFLILLFVFTLGLHLGKNAKFQNTPTALPSAQAISNEKEETPSRSELTFQSKIAYEQLDEILEKTLQEEVKTTQLHLQKPKSTELPQNTKTSQVEENEEP